MNQTFRQVLFFKFWILFFISEVLLHPGLHIRKSRLRYNSNKLNKDVLEERELAEEGGGGVKALADCPQDFVVRLPLGKW